MADYSKTTWVAHSTNVSASLLNHGETQYDTAKSEYQAGSWGGAATYIDQADYIIYRSGSTYYAKDAKTGNVVSTNTLASTVFQYCADQLNALTPKGGLIACRFGPFVMLTKVTLSTGTFIDGGGCYFDCTGLNNTVFEFGVNTIAGWGSPSTTTSGSRRTGIANCNVDGTRANTSTLFVKISQVCYGAMVDNITLGRVHNFVEFWGACYDAVVNNCRTGYTDGTFVRLVGEYLTDTNYCPNNTHITNCEVSAVSTTAVGISNEDDGGANSFPGEDIQISNCWFEGVHIGIHTDGWGVKVSNCNIITGTSGTGHMGIRSTSDGYDLLVTNSVLYGSLSDSICIEAGSRLNVNGCTFDYLACKAIHISNSDSYGRIVGNRFAQEGGSTASIFITGQLQYCNIVGNIFFTTTATHTGISGDNGSNLNVISGNTFYGLLVGITGYSDGTVIGNNMFYTCTTGIDFNHITTTQSFVGNVFYSCTATVANHTAAPNDYGNFGYVVKKAGTTQFTAAATLVVTHGMATTPTKVLVTGTDAYTIDCRVTAKDATTFTVTRGNSTGTPWIYWYAEV